MTVPGWHWLQRDRVAFCAKLAETGDPVQAAAAVGRSISEAYRMREAIPAFAGAWQRALEIAWDLVETRVLSGLLAQAGADSDKPVKLIDSRMALAVLQKRDAPRTVRGAPVDGGRVSALRDEIRALAMRAGR